MTSNSKVLLLRFARGVAAVVVASVAAFAVGPGLDIVPNQFDNLVIVLGAPALLVLEKFLRDGGQA